MRLWKLSAVLALLAATPATAQGDAAAGEAAFRQCVACHVVTTPTGDTLAGRAGRSGPNLYGIAGGPAGAVDGFRYSGGLEALKGAAVVWTEDNFVAYVQDPSDFVRQATGNGAARSSMSFRVRNETDARDLYAYLLQLGQ
jgi:cytochrome c